MIVATITVIVATAGLLAWIAWLVFTDDSDGWFSMYIAERERAQDAEDRADQLEAKLAAVKTAWNEQNPWSDKLDSLLNPEDKPCE